MLRIDRPADRPHGPLLPFDPDHDPFFATRVVDSAQLALRAAAVVRVATHGREDTIASRWLFRILFSFLFPALIGRGASRRLRDPRALTAGAILAEILEDRYVQNRLTPEQRARLLDRPEVIKAIGNDTIADARHTIEA